MVFFIHPTAVVDDGATIGSGTKVWHFCHVMSGAIIGNDCILGQNVYVDKGTNIGNRVKIQNNVSVYTGVHLEDDVFIGPSVVFTNVLNPRSFIERKHEFKETIVRAGASIGANATILCGVEIGAYALVGAGSVVIDSVAPYEMVVGTPARLIGWVSRNGHRLQFDNEGIATCPATGEKYKLLGNNVLPFGK